MNKTLIGILIVLLLIGCTSHQQNTSNEPIKIGFIGPLTGDAADYGIVARDSINLAVDEINTAGGINNQRCGGNQRCLGAGRPLQIIWEDGKCNGREANTAAQKLISEDHVKIILFGGCSGEVLGAAPILEQNHVIGFGPYTSSPDITNAGDYIFRNSYSDKDSGKAAAETIAKKYKTVGVIAELTDFAQAYKKVFIEEFDRQGGKVLMAEDYQPESRDFRTSLLKIINSKPTAIFVNPQSSATGIAILQQLREQRNTIPVYTNFFLSSEDAQKNAGNAAENVVFIADPKPAGTQTQTLFEKYKQIYGKDPTYAYPLPATYDAVYMLAKAIREVGYDGEKIKNWLYKMPDYEGTLGTYHFDENGDVVGIKPVVKIMKDGKVEMEG